MSSQRDRVITALLGGQGMGKTVLMKYFLWKWNIANGPALVVDNSFNYRQYGQEYWQDAVSDDPRDKGRIVSGSVRQLQYFRKYMALGLVCIDDYDAIFKKQNPDLAVLREYQTQPRHGIGDSIVAMRTFNACPSELETAFTWIYVCRTNHDNTIRRIAGNTGHPELVELEKKLQPLEALRVYCRNMTVPIQKIDIAKQILPKVIEQERRAAAGEIAYPVISTSGWFKNRANTKKSS